MTERSSEFRRKSELEELLAEINELLGGAETEIMGRYTAPRHPVVLVLGCCRSGTTLLMQWLAATGQFAYPSNLLSRFYGAPGIGARIQRLFTDPEFQVGEEFAGISQEISFESLLGKTRGPLSPNEFWYFWRRFIPNTEPRCLSSAEEARIDGAGLAAELAAIEAAFGKPLAAKGIILQFNLPALAAILPKVLFIHVKRHPFYNAQSLVLARERFFGTRDAWYSAKPPEYEELVSLDPIRQVAGQVYYTNRALEAVSGKFPAENWLTVDYEEFCEHPKSYYEALKQKIEAQGTGTLAEYGGPASFEAANAPRLTPEDAEALMQAYGEFSGKELQF